jgi:hypothetical protein
MLYVRVVKRYENIVPFLKPKLFLCPFVSVIIIEAANTKTTYDPICNPFSDVWFGCRGIKIFFDNVYAGINEKKFGSKKCIHRQYR